MTKARASALYPDGVATAIRYARDVVSGKPTVCRLVRLTCDRFLDELQDAERRRGGWEFRADLAERAMMFAGLMPNIKGPEAGRPLRLMPWQRLVFANRLCRAWHDYAAVPPGCHLRSPWQRQNVRRRTVGALPQFPRWRGRC